MSLELIDSEMKQNFLRIKWMHGGFVAVLVTLLLVGCSRTPDVQPLKFNAAPWLPNESSTYQLTDINGNYAGTARYDLALIDGEVWNLRREINAQGTQEIVAVDMSQVGFRPVQSTIVRIAKDGTEVVSAKYSGSQADMELTTKLNITTMQRVSIPSDAREQATLVMLLRALPLAENYAVRLNVFLPIVGILDRVTVMVEKREQVTTLAGTFDTWYVRMETPNSETEAWVSTQAPYPVVKFIDSRNGGIFELSEFQAGQ